MLIIRMDAFESTLNSLSAQLIPVPEIAPVTVFVAKHVSLISWYVPLILLTCLCSLHAAVRDSCSQRLSPQLMHILISEGVFGLRSFFRPHQILPSEDPFLSLCTEVSFRIAILSLNCLFVGGHPICFRKDRAENVYLLGHLFEYTNQFLSPLS